jgi:hypothetical protein
MGMPVLKYLALDLVAAADARQRGRARRVARRRRFPFGLVRPRAQTSPVAPIAAVGSVALKPAAVAVEATVS